MKRIFLSLMMLSLAGFLVAACARQADRESEVTTATPVVIEVLSAEPVVTGKASAGQATVSGTLPAPTATAALPTPIPDEPATIRYWEQEPADYDRLLDELGAEFMAEHPHITVERIHFGSEELLEQFQAAVELGEAPALLRATHELAAPMGSLGIVRPVEEIFEQPFFDAFIPGALEPATISGTLYAVPDNYGSSLLMLLYNKDLVSTVPEDTDAWIEQLVTLTDSSVRQYGLVYNVAEPFWLVPWLGGFGGRPLDENNWPELDSQAMIDALQFVHDLKYVYEVIPAETNYDAADLLFRQGMAAYIINGEWSLPIYHQTEGLDFGVAPLPRISGTGEWPTPLAGGKYWYFSRDAEGAKMEAARKFVEYMTSADVQRRWLALNRLPSSREVAGDQVVKNEPVVAGTLEQVIHSRGLPAAPQMQCVWNAIRPGLEAVISDRLTATEAAENMQQEAELCISQMSEAGS